MKTSGWTYSRRVHELYAAKWWGCPSPKFFDRLSKDEKISILALYEIENKMSVINSFEESRKINKKTKKPKTRRGRH